MFRANDTQQITVYDSFLNQPAHIQRLIEKSWAKDFSDVIFPAIHEDRFSVLYSGVGSRPNTPVNVLVGSMLLKEYSWAAGRTCPWEAAARRTECVRRSELTAFGRPHHRLLNPGTGA